MTSTEHRTSEPFDTSQSSRRVVVKLRETPASAADEQSPGRTAFSERMQTDDGELTRAVRRMHPDGSITRYLHEDEPISAGRRAAMDPFVAVTVTDAESGELLARELTALDSVELAYLEAGPTPPPQVQPSDDPRNLAQGYLDAAPVGIDARWAWSRTDGAGVRFVDLEQGWLLGHEDLSGAGIGLISGINRAYQGHGTAVLGEVVAVDNTRGGVGIAPKAIPRVVSQWRTTTVYGTAAAILSAVDSMSAGDVLLLEAQTTVGGSDFLPVEVEPAVFSAISAATDAGIIVIEAGGNGSIDLDAWTDASGHHSLKRSDPSFRDSGAIMVGAAGSSAPHSRLAFSNFGSRIDCFGWGENIDTTGDGWMGTSLTGYTSSFGGTSGASPIVAGAAVLLQSWRRRTRARPLDPSTLRALLSGSNNTRSASPASDRIGVMPDLRAIIEALISTDRFWVRADEYLRTEYILFGLLDDAPGVIWVPGKGPVPVDPGWGKVAKTARDRFLAVLTRELEAAGIDGVTVDAVEGAANAALARTLESGDRRVPVFG